MILRLLNIKAAFLYDDSDHEIITEIPEEIGITSSIVTKYIESETISKAVE